MWPPRLPLLPEVAWIGGAEGYKIQVAHGKIHIEAPIIYIFLTFSPYSPYPSGLEHAALFFAILHVFSIRPLYIPRRRDWESFLALWWLQLRLAATG